MDLDCSLFFSLLLILTHLQTELGPKIAKIHHDYHTLGDFVMLSYSFLVKLFMMSQHNISSNLVGGANIMKSEKDYALSQPLSVTLD